MSFDWKKTLATVAPTIATALGGPLAGVAVKIAADSLGIEADETTLAEAVNSGNPEVLAKLKQANQEFLVKMRELDIKETQIHILDRQDAREREERLGGTFVPFLGAFILIGFFAMVLLVLMGYAQASSVLAGTLIGYVSAKAEQVVAYYFGSSHGSKNKTEAMSEAIKRASK